MEKTLGIIVAIFAIVGGLFAAVASWKMLSHPKNTRTSDLKTLKSIRANH